MIDRVAPIVIVFFAVFGAIVLIKSRFHKTGAIFEIERLIAAMAGGVSLGAFGGVFLPG